MVLKFGRRRPLFRAREGSSHLLSQHGQRTQQFAKWPNCAVVATSQARGLTTKAWELPNLAMRGLSANGKVST